MYHSVSNWTPVISVNKGAHILEDWAVIRVSCLIWSRVMAFGVLWKCMYSFATFVVRVLHGARVKTRWWDVVHGVVWTFPVHYGKIIKLKSESPTLNFSGWFGVWTTPDELKGFVICYKCGISINVSINSCEFTQLWVFPALFEYITFQHQWEPS